MSSPYSPDLTSHSVIQGLQAWGIEYTDNQIEQVLAYRDLLVEWNATKMNLTRIVEPEAVGVQHFLNSLSILKYCRLAPDSTLLDVGTGAGFPGLAIKIFRPDIKVTLLEATAKKLMFCSAVCEALGLEDVELVHGRAENDLHKVKRFSFNTVTARAVAELGTLIEWCTPYMRHRSGQLLALKGGKGAEELHAASPVLAWGGFSGELINVAIPGSDHIHTIIRVAKSHGE